MKKFLALILVAVMALSMVACSSGSSSDSGDPDAEHFEDRGYRIAYLVGAAPSDVFQIQNDAAKAEAESLGIDINFFFSGGDAAKLQDYFQQFINEDYDAIYCHGANSTYAYEMIKPALDKGIKVLAMEYECRDENGNIPEGVVEMKQDDQQMSDAICSYAIEEIYPDKEQINVLKLFFETPFEPFIRREAALQAYVDSGKFNIVDTIGPTDTASPIDSIMNNVAAILPVKGEQIDLIWACYDAYAQGAYLALKDADMNIPIVTVDVSNEDLTYMLEDGSSFAACASPAPESIGQQAVRILAMMLNGDEIEDQYMLTASLVPQSQLKEGASITNLQEMIDGYGVSEDHYPDWMKEVQERVRGN